MSMSLGNMKYNLDNYSSVIYLFVDLLSLNLTQNCSIHSHVSVFANVFTSYNFVGTIVIYREQEGLLLQAVPTCSLLFTLKQCYFSLYFCCQVEDTESIRSFRDDL